MNKDVFKKAFENVKPSEELVNSVLDIPNVSAVPKKTRRRSFFGKYRRAAVIAFCGLMVCGCTAAATNVVNFSEIFGRYFSSYDSDYAKNLVGSVKDFSYKVSDDDYQISIKGVTGTEENFSVIAEISRKDGTPVDEHFLNPAKRNYYLDELWIESTDGFSGGWDISLNNEGNIEIYQEFRTTFEEPINIITIQGENFYPPELYKEFCKKNNVSYIKWDDFNFSGYALRDETGSITSEHIVPADIDDSGIIALDLEWEFSFKPVTTKVANKAKICQNPEESFMYTRTRLNHNGEYVDNITAPLKPSLIEVKSTGARIEFDHVIFDYKYEYDYIEVDLSPKAGNKCCLIKKDGSQIPAGFSGMQMSVIEDDDIEGSYEGSMDIVYLEEEGDLATQTVVNIKDIKAISINGTVYELN